MQTTVDIGKAGEAHAVQWLKQKGYTINSWDTQSPGSTDIEASGSSTWLLVQVKSAISPNNPANLSADEERNIKSRAARIGAQAWEARVQMNALYQLIGEIKWRRLD